MKIFVYILIGALVLFLIRKFLSKFKFPKIGALAVFVGGVKSGKSAVSVGCTISNWKKAHRRWKISCFFVRFFNVFRKNKREFPEEPLIYSSIPLRGVPYVPLTRAHLLRQVRFNYGSIVFIDEASLVADSQLIKDKEINTQLLLFFKLFGHETHGGKCIVNTHCLTDLHFALKRTTSQYFYLHHLSKYIPFFTLAYMREERYSEDGSSTNIYNEDLEDTLKRVLFKTSTFKRYDSFCFSSLTDDLPLANKLEYRGKDDDLKAQFITSFRPEFYTLRFGKEKIDYNTGEVLPDNKEISENEKKND